MNINMFHYCSNLIPSLITITIAIMSTCTTSFSENNSGFSIKEASLQEIQTAFKQNKLTSRKLVEFYISEIQRLNGELKSVIEVNPDALFLADEADKKRKQKARPESSSSVSLLDGVPILLKDNIATKDKLNTTAGSYALLGSVVPRDAFVVEKLRKVGAIILGKASMTEWAAYRSNGLPNGWNARCGQTVNPYAASMDPCGSSTGSAVSVAANMATVSLGTETAGSILCPSGANSVVGIKPTVGLTSRAGVVPISPRQDTIGPICRTVTDAVHVLDAIVGFDQLDTATKEASKYIPQRGYSQFLKSDGLKGKRLGISSIPVSGFRSNPDVWKTFQPHLNILREKGAILVEGLELANLSSILDTSYIVINTEFKLALNAYLKQLVSSPIRSLADAIEFNKKNSKLEKINDYGQDVFLEAEKTNGIGRIEKKGLANLRKACKEGFEKMMKKHKLDALVTISDNFYFVLYFVLGIGGYPGINVPAGYEKDGSPFGITFSGLKFSEARLIEVAYGFEQATNFRKPPSI